MYTRKIMLAVLLVMPLGAAVVSTWLTLETLRAKASSKPVAQVSAVKSTPGLELGFELKRPD